MAPKSIADAPFPLSCGDLVFLGVIYDFGSVDTRCASSLLVRSGSGQTAAPGSLVPVSPAVLVHNASGVPVPGVTVIFRVTEGGGTIVGPVATTDKNGVASIGNWRLGQSEGTNRLVARLYVGELPKTQTFYPESVEFTAMATTTVPALTGHIVFACGFAFNGFPTHEEICVMGPDQSIRQLTNTSYPTVNLQPAWSRDGTKIAFFRSENTTTTGIYVMNANGSNILHLTTGIDQFPTWSPDGSKIAFDRAEEIYLMNADGSDIWNLTNSSAHDAHPAWSPDGTRIAFASDRGGYWDIWVMNTDGTGLKQLTNTPEADQRPAWSPDGSAIAFASPTGTKGNMEVYIMNSDGTGVRRITYNPRYG
jgi:hypothetical protein